MSFTKPRQYAREKLPMLRSRFDGEAKTLFDRMVPVAFPNAPRDQMVLCLLGFTAFSTGWGENTTEAVLTQSFHEVSLLQCPAGPRSGPAPNTDPNAPNNAYGKLARTSLVKRMLGQPESGPGANMAHNGWKTDHASALAVGIANLLADEAALRRSIGDVCGATGGWSHWRLWCMFTAFSRGPGQTTKILRPYRDRLLAVNESVRLRQLRALVVTDIANNTPGIGSKTGKMGASYGLLRSDQKLESAWLLATDKHRELPLLGERYTDSEQDRVIEETLSRTSAGNVVTVATDTVREVTTHIAQIAAEANTSTKVIAVAAIGAGLAAAIAGARA